MSDTALPQHELVMSRYFAAPPSAVYQAFIDPKQISMWFGPLSFHVPLSSIDVEPKAGGHWKMTMVNNDDPSITSPVHSHFVELVENQLIVGYEIVNGFPGIPDGTKLTMTVELHAEGDGTRLELRQGPFPEDLASMTDAGWSQSFHKLDALLATPAEFLDALGE